VATRRRVETRPSVERKIYFYRADAGADEGGRPLCPLPHPSVLSAGNEATVCAGAPGSNGSPGSYGVQIFERHRATPLVERAVRLGPVAVEAAR
jgi:hypothetical protein